MNPKNLKRSWILSVFSLLVILFGTAIAIPGIQLVTLGGSFYYAISGSILILAGILLWRGSATGAWIYYAILGGTVIWSVWESGLDGWALLPRLNLFVLFGVVLGLILWRSSRAGRVQSRSKPWPHAGKAALGIASLLVLGGALTMTRGDAASPSPEKTALSNDGNDWQQVGNSTANERFSSLSDITPANVNELKVAWKVRLGMPPAGMVGALEATPIKIADTLYICNMHNQVLALNAETGATRWRFDPQMDRNGVVVATCRGVTYVAVPGASGFCAARIVIATHDARLVAVDSATGRRCPAFGTNGEVNLLDGMGDIEKVYYAQTSPPVLVQGKLVIGGSVLDGQATEGPSGVIRAYDAVTGQFAWAWDMGRPNDRKLPLKGEHFTFGTPNSWPGMAADEALGLVYVPLGNATPDYVTAHRTPEMNAYNDTVVALDVATGDPRWSYQTTRRDVWDYDNASPPTLVDFPTASGPKPAIIIPTKRGQLFVLDRRTGQPLVAVEDRAVPQHPVSGETVSPTQPYSVGMPSFGGERLTEARMWGLSPFDQLWCRIKFREARYDGDFTPVGLKPTIAFPGFMGGSNWGGVAVDPIRRLLVVNVNHFPALNQQIPREEANRRHVKAFRAGAGMELDYRIWPQEGARYATKVVGFTSPIGVPCNQPPFSEIAVVDLSTQKTLWKHPLGTGRDSGPFGLRSMLLIRMGVPMMGGSLVTKGGLVFIAATQERSFRAFDITTGDKIWESRLPAGGHANPMSYRSPVSNRQFVVVASSGHPQMQNGAEDYLVAFALPAKK